MLRRTSLCGAVGAKGGAGLVMTKQRHITGRREISEVLECFCNMNGAHFLNFKRLIVAVGVDESYDCLYLKSSSVVSGAGYSVESSLLSRKHYDLSS